MSTYAQREVIIALRKENDRLQARIAKLLDMNANLKDRRAGGSLDAINKKLCEVNKQLHADLKKLQPFRAQLRQHISEAEELLNRLDSERG